MEKNSISSLFDVVPHLYSTEYVPYPMFIGIENIINTHFALSPYLKILSVYPFYHVSILPCPLFVFDQKKSRPHETRQDKTRRDQTRQDELKVALLPLISGRINIFIHQLCEDMFGGVPEILRS